MTAARTRGIGLFVAAAAALLLTSHPRIVGDGGEYVTQAMNFASLHGPSLGRHEIPAIQHRLAAIDPNLAGYIEANSIASADRRDFVHFWMYTFLATPALWIADAVGARPESAFAMLNLVMLGLAVWVLLPRIGGAATALIVGGPLIWWMDKPHTEIFSVSLIAIALALMRERPGLALVAAGLASTQNIPIAALYVAIFTAHVATRQAAPGTDAPGTNEPGTRNLAPGTEFVLGAVLGLCLVMLQPGYTWFRHGTVSLLINSTLRGLPRPSELAAVLVDLNVGLIFCAPAFAAAVALAVAVVARRQPRRLLTPETIVASVTAIGFLVAFASTVNVHHGGTPGMSRYALWLLPLAIPVFVQAHAMRVRAWTIGAIVAAVISSVMAVVSYHPARAEKSAEPSRLAVWLWSTHPGWSNPLPEVFSEVVWGEEGTRVPTATSDCEKVLLAASHRGWPIPCEPSTIPSWCAAARDVCYANRNAAQDGYTFVHLNVRERPRVLESATWPQAAESHVREWFAARGWRDLQRTPGGLDVLRASFGVSTIPLGNAGRFVLVVNKPEPGATLAFRLPGPATGELLDPVSGTIVEDVSYAGPANEMWTLPVPAGYDILILDMHGVRSR